MRVGPEAYQRSDPDPVGGRGDWPRGEVTPCGRAGTMSLIERYTLGVEEELMLLEPR